MRHVDFFYIKNKINDFLKQHWFFIIPFFISFCVGLTIGCIVIIQYVKRFEIETMIEVFYGEKLVEVVSFFKLFFSIFYKALLCFIVLILVSLIKWTRWLIGIILACIGYYFGTIMTGVILVFGAGGVISLILCLIPFCLITFVFYCVFSCCIWKEGCCFEQYRCFRSSKLLVFILIYICILIFILLLFSICCTKTIRGFF